MVDALALQLSVSQRAELGKRRVRVSLRKVSDLKFVACNSASLSGRVTTEFDRIGMIRFFSSGFSPCPV